MLEMVQDYAVDSYYQVILRKHEGVETLRLVANSFPAIEVVELVESILKRLLENDANTTNSGVSVTSCCISGLAVKAPADGVAIDICAFSPTTVTTKSLQNQNAYEDKLELDFA
jgi:hypothetical protein